jgi:hypothetical protein
METVFKISFYYKVSPDFHLEMNAQVQLHHSEPHYVIRNIGNNLDVKNISVLPDCSIKAIKNGNEEITWVHTDSERQTILSQVVGKAIEKTVKVEVSDYND